MRLIAASINLRRRHLAHLRRFRRGAPISDFRRPVRSTGEMPIKPAHLVLVQATMADLSGDAEIRSQVFSWAKDPYGMQAMDEIHHNDAPDQYCFDRLLVHGSSG